MREIGVSLGEGDGELGGGVGGAEEEIGDGLPAADAGVPGFEDAGDLIDPGHGDGVAGDEDDDGARVGLGDGGDEGVLVVGRARVGASPPSLMYWSAKTMATSADLAKAAAARMSVPGLKSTLALGACSRM